jgi:hypothetical protein
VQSHLRVRALAGFAVLRYLRNFDKIREIDFDASHDAAINEGQTIRIKNEEKIEREYEYARLARYITNCMTYLRRSSFPVASLVESRTEHQEITMVC